MAFQMSGNRKKYQGYYGKPEYENVYRQTINFEHPNLCGLEIFVTDWLDIPYVHMKTRKGQISLPESEYLKLVAAINGPLIKCLADCNQAIEVKRSQQQVQQQGFGILAGNGSLSSMGGNYIVVNGRGGITKQGNAAVQQLDSNSIVVSHEGALSAGGGAVQQAATAVVAATTKGKRSRKNNSAEGSHTTAEVSSNKKKREALSETEKDWLLKSGVVRGGKRHDADELQQQQQQEQQHFQESQDRQDTEDDDE